MRVLTTTLRSRAPGSTLQQILEEEARMRRRVKTLTGVATVLLTISLGVSVGNAPPARANGACDAATTYAQVGNATNQNGQVANQKVPFEGASADMTVQGNRLFCSGDTDPKVNYSTAWVGVFSNPGSGHAQTGTMFRYGYSCGKYWAEVDSGDGNFTDYELKPCQNPDGSTHLFTQEAVLVNGVYHQRSIIDGQTVYTTGFNPFSSWSFPLVGAWDGETHHLTSNVPGSSSATTHFTYAQVQAESNDQFVGTCNNTTEPGFNQNSSNWSRRSNGCNDWELWSN